MSAPEIDTLVGFDDPLTLYPAGGGRFESKPYTSGAALRIRTAGTAVVRCEIGADWKFNATPETKKPNVNVGDQPTLTMDRTLSTALSNAVNVSITVKASMEGETTFEQRSRVVTVKYATLFQRLLRFFDFSRTSHE